jgi:predicted  nucleic acid-binding Zn-ribbon protein
MLAAMTLTPVPNLILLPPTCSRCGCVLAEDDLDLIFGCPECGRRIGDEYDEAEAAEEEIRAILEWLEGDAVYA